MDHNSPIVSCKKDLIDFLKSRTELSYIDIREDYIKVDIDLPLAKPLITVSKGKILTEDISYQNYLGEKYDDINIEIVETNGKILYLYYDLHIWNSKTPKHGGMKEIERIQERIKSIVEFESNALEDKDITFLSFEEGTLMEDPFEEDLFHCRCTLKLKILWKKEFRFEVMNEIIAHGELE